MPIIMLSCGCKYDKYRKCVIKYCRHHFESVIAENINRQKQLNDELIQQQASRQQQKPEGFHIKPIFGRPKKYHLKPLFS